LRLLRADHDTLLASTDVRDELVRIHDRFAEENRHLRATLASRDTQI
jgi:hypothetical protein